jgi:hypothetical protein
MVDLRVSHLEHIVIAMGDLKGRPAYRMNAFAHDKMQKLRVGGQTTLRTDEGFNQIVDDTDDPWSTYKLMHHLITNHLPPGYDDVLFVRRAPEKVLKLRRGLGQAFEGNTELLRPDKNGCRKVSGKLGRNAPCELFKKLALQCNFNNPKKVTGRAPRRTGLSQMVAVGTSGHAMLKCGAKVADLAGEATAFGTTAHAVLEAGRHKSIETSGLYVVGSDPLRDEASTALHTTTLQRKLLGAGGTGDGVNQTGNTISFFANHFCFLVLLLDSRRVLFYFHASNEEEVLDSKPPAQPQSCPMPHGVANQHPAVTSQEQQQQQAWQWFQHFQQWQQQAGMSMIAPPPSYAVVPPKQQQAQQQPVTTLVGPTPTFAIAPPWPQQQQHVTTMAPPPP